MSKFNDFWETLKRRQVLRVALTYLVVSWLLVQIGAIVFPALNLPEWTITLLIVLLLFIFPIAIFLAWTYEKGPDGFVVTKSSGAGKDTAPAKQKRSSTINFVLLALLVLMVGWYFVRPAITSNSNSKNSALLQNKSIAVLYFDNMSGDPDQEFFSDGITEEITARLAKVEGIRVISRTSTRVYKGQPINLKKIAAELNVSAVLEGSFRKSGNQIKITAQLINAETDEHIWAETYSRELKDIFQVQTDIAHAIAQKFEMDLSSETTVALNRFPTANVKAYEYYLNARHILYNVHAATGDSLDFVRSKEMFEKAIELDATFAEAYAGLSDLYDSYRNVAYESFTDRMDSTRHALSRKAYILDPNSSFVNHVRGWMFIHVDDPIVDSAYYYFKKARRIDPNDYLNYNGMGSILRIYQLDDMALPYYLETVKVNPLNAHPYAHIGFIYYLLGELENSNKAFQKAYDIGLTSGFSDITGIVLWLISNNRLEEAKELIEGHEIKSTFHDAYLLFWEGNHSAAREIAANINFEHGGWQGKAELYSLLDDKDKALEALRYGMEINVSMYLWIKNSERWQKYKADPEYQDVLEAHKKIYKENKLKYGYEFDNFMNDDELMSSLFLSIN